MESSSMSDDGGMPVQRRAPRRKKSAEQVELLERLYAENKYPSEDLRAKLSVQIGLSEKQLAIWFTHRRHKDRKDGVEDAKLTFYAMRHKGGEAHEDFMEELSSGKRTGESLSGKSDASPSGSYPPVSYSRGSSVQQVIGDRRTDSDSENSSGLGHADDFYANRLMPSMKRVCPINRKGGAYKRPAPVPPRANVEAKSVVRDAISAVETQLGGSIRKDGPHLAMEFDSVPPGAWEHLAYAAVPPTAIQGRGLMAVQGREPMVVHGRGPMAIQGRVGKYQSVGSY